MSEYCEYNITSKSTIMCIIPVKCEILLKSGFQVIRQVSILSDQPEKHKNYKENDLQTNLNLYRKLVSLFSTTLSLWSFLSGQRGKIKASGGRTPSLNSHIKLCVLLKGFGQKEGSFGPNDFCVWQQTLD